MDGNPLVSICFTCYNRANYVAEAFDSVLKQTYSPLEIVVSDNCSDDGTREIVETMIQSYKEKGGSHRFLVNVNESNIGGLKNIEKAITLSSGELVVFASDDDISLPNRVEVIVNAWLETKKTATAIVHGWYKINPRDQYVGEQAPWGALNYWDVVNQDHNCLMACWPHGAASAVIPDVVRKFTPVVENAAYEDYCWLYRAMMLGVPRYLPDRLVEYRIGSGISSAFQVRKTQVRSGEGGLSAGKQALRDLEEYKKNLSGEWYWCVRSVIGHHNTDCQEVVKCFSATGVKEKWTLIRNSRNLMLQNTLRRRYLLPLFLLPNHIGDSLINAATLLLWRYRAWKYRHHPLNKQSKGEMK